MAAKEIAEEAIKKMNKRITNEIFLIIQNDRELMKEYLRAVEGSGLDTVNQKPRPHLGFPAPPFPACSTARPASPRTWRCALKRPLE
jgi:hypothetical protein